MEVEDLVSQEFNKIRGRILGLVESFNLDSKHEKAIKQVFKQWTYDFQGRFVENFYEEYDQH